MKEQTERQRDEGRQGKHRMRLTRKKRVVISVILAFFCPSGAAGFCLAVYASKHGDDNESKYAKRIADRSRRCKTDPAAGAEQY